MSTGLKVLLGALAALLALPLLAFTVYAVDMVDLRIGAPDADDAEVRTARAKAMSELTRRTDTLLTALGVGPADVLARSQADECHEGSHNVNVDTSYDLLCTGGVFVSVAGGVTTDWPAESAALDAALRADGWTAPVDSSLSARVTQLAGAGTQAPLYDGNRDGDLGPADLAAAVYRSGDLELSIVFAERPPGGAQRFDETNPGWHSMGYDIAPDLPVGRYATVLRLSATTFEG